MGNGGTTRGPVVRWDDVRGGAVTDVTEVPGGRWADRSIVGHGTAGTAVNCAPARNSSGPSRETAACRSRQRE